MAPLGRLPVPTDGFLLTLRKHVARHLLIFVPSVEVSHRMRLVQAGNWDSQGIYLVQHWVQPRNL